MPIDHHCLVAVELVDGRREHGQVAVDGHAGEGLGDLRFERRGLAVAVVRLPIVGAAPAEAHVADGERDGVVIDVEQVAGRLVGVGLHTIASDCVPFDRARLNLQAEVRVIDANDVGLLVVAVGAALAPHAGVGHLQPEDELALKHRADKRAAHERRHRAVIVEGGDVKERVAALSNGPQSALGEPMQLKVERVRDDRCHVCTHASSSEIFPIA